MQGRYCAEQSSLMRGFAFGILDPAGERYALAMAHQRECPACRAHVLSLRGLASVLPPLPLPWVLGAGMRRGRAVRARVRAPRPADQGRAPVRVRARVRAWALEPVSGSVSACQAREPAGAG